MALLKRAKAKDKRLQTLTPADPRRAKGFSQAYTLEVTRRANTVDSFMVTMMFTNEDYFRFYDCLDGRRIN